MVFVMYTWYGWYGDEWVDQGFKCGQIRYPLGSYIDCTYAEFPSRVPRLPDELEHINKL